ncbi:ArnT family glycosyltransferase [Clostridium sp. DL1XJH146]
MFKKRLTNEKILILVLLILFFIVNLLFLTKFPFVHSDESWLSGLSRNIMEKNDFSVTESFFDLYGRHPHAIKSLFHSIQIIFLKIFGYKIFTFRLISLIFGTMSLFFFYKLCSILFHSKKLGTISAFLLAIDIQFIYASHFARQEIIILFNLLFCLYIYFNNNIKHKYNKDILLGVLIGISIGIHPNSFIISLPFGVLYLYNIFYTKKIKLKNLITLISITSLFAVFFILLSFKFDPNFLHNYMAFGNQFGVLDPAISKFENLKLFYLKLHYGISGTYYTPNIKLQFYIFIASLIGSIIKVFFIKDNQKKENYISIILAIISINIGIVLIGRFNATSIVFLFPLFYILLVFMISDLKKYKIPVIFLIAILLIFSSYNNISPYLSHDYQEYLNEIGKVVKKEDTVLANLNTEYYFNNEKLFDYRNLTFLNENNLKFSDYIYDHDIDYIIYSDEMDFIYNSRPIWNGLYGNLYYYYDDMKNFLDTNCTEVHEFKDNVYGIRIVRYMDQKDWWIRIYKVKK